MFEVDKDSTGNFPTFLFTENDTNYERIGNSMKKNASKYVKDAFHQYVIKGIIKLYFHLCKVNHS